MASWLAVYLNAVKSGGYDFFGLVTESGLVCSKCGSAACAKYHGTWFRKSIHDLRTGELFKNIPIIRIRFCDGRTKSLFPAELWRGRSTVSSVLEAVSIAVSCGVEQALQWAMDAGDGDEVVSERTVRRWIKRTTDRVPVASEFLHFPPDMGQPPAAKLENFLTRIYPCHLLDLRRQWGFSILDVPPPEKRRRSSSCLKPIFQNPRPAQNPPSEYVRRGTRSRLSRRGRSPDD